MSAFQKEKYVRISKEKYVRISKGERNLCGEICPHLFLSAFEVASPSDFIFPSFILTKQRITPEYLTPKTEYHVNFELLSLKLPTYIDFVENINDISLGKC